MAISFLKGLFPNLPRMTFKLFKKLGLYKNTYIIAKKNLFGHSPSKGLMSDSEG